MELSRVWHVRDMLPSDKLYIINTWRQNYRDTAADLTAHMPYPEYRSTWIRIITTLLNTCGARVAALDDDDDTIVGWACVDKRRKTMHYVYVRDVWRRMGVARDLIAGAERERYKYSHLTNTEAPVPVQWVHAPWALITIAAG